MGQWEFYNEFKELCEYYNNKIFENKKITKMYYEKVKSMPINEFKNMCNEFINTYKFMPRVADFDITNSLGHRGRNYTETFLESFYDNV